MVMAIAQVTPPSVASRNKTKKYKKAPNMNTIQYITPAIEELELSLEGVLCGSQSGTEDLFEQEGEW